MELITFTILIALAVALPLYSRRKRYRLPPGPKGLPIVGNAFDIPAKCEWFAYADWSRKYDSDIIYLNIAGTPTYILNSVQATSDLLERRSAIYSDRVRLTMSHEIVGWEQNFAFMPYGDVWRERRRMFHQHFHPGVSGKYHTYMEKQAKDLLRRVCANPDGLMQHLRVMAGATILRVLYGIEVQQENDHYLGIAEAAINSIALTGNAGSYLVDYIPILRYLPSWAPGAQFKRDGAKWRSEVERMLNEPLDFVMQRMATDNGEPSDCVTAELLNRFDERDGRTRAELVAAVKQMAVTAYVGGADTTVSTIGTFVLAMVKYPDVQRLAQAEIDRVVGHGRLPSLDDKVSLPYVTAVVKETLRWNLVTPLAIPHKVTTDDDYKGFFIPAGSIVIGNAWAVLHDEIRYPNSHLFAPARFLTPEGEIDKAAPDPAEACFGFGRRICPGRHFALDSIWITIAYILATINIEKALDEKGIPFEPSGEYTPGLLSHPVPFKASFTSRSHAADLLMAEA